MKQYNLKDLGFTDHFEQEAAKFPHLYAARVSEQHRELYKVLCQAGELQAKVSGKFSYTALDAVHYPAVGDWVLIDRLDGNSGDGVIHQILPRKSLFERKAAGTANHIQVVAANIDTVFLCMALNDDFNLRRLERYLSVAYASMAVPVVVLTKADLCTELPVRLEQVYSVAIGVDVLVTSSISQDGIEQIKPYICPGQTVAFIGSSGVGKSTLINLLMGSQVLATKEIRSDDKGRHTTTHRQLLLLPEGGMVIDTPGMRELQLDSADLSKSFEDIEGLALGCRFKDCSHKSEPGCMVQQAIEDGRLSAERFESYQKLKREMGYEGLDSRQLEQQKIKNMFGSMGEMKQVMDQAKRKNKRRS